MPRINKETKEQIRNLSRKELEAIVIKLASAKENYQYLLVHYLDKENGEMDLFNEAMKELEELRYKNYNGYEEVTRFANFIKACARRINEFKKVVKNNKLEADLLLSVIEFVFEVASDLLGTCFTTFDTQLAIQLRKLINIVTKKLHSDYIVEYRKKINQYLVKLHEESDHLDTVYNLPESI